MHMMRTSIPSTILIIVLVAVLRSQALTVTRGFLLRPSSPPPGNVLRPMSNNNNQGGNSIEEDEDLRAKAERLLAEAQALRAELPKAEDSNNPRVGEVATVDGTTITTVSPSSSPWSLLPPQDGLTGVDYTIEMDIGREEGTWMDPRWGASGRRVECTLQVRFVQGTGGLADGEVRKKMVRDNVGGSSSPVFVLQSAPFARLRGGFDRMECRGGGYRLDNKNTVVRFFVEVDGKTDGDVSIPAGCLYFSIPVFGTVSQLSTKAGWPVTVRQVGWNTGWRREESRIVGTFRARKKP